MYETNSQPGAISRRKGPSVKVEKTNKAEVEEWVRKKHYSRRPSIFWAGFALIINGNTEGVIVYGQPSPPLQLYAFKDRTFKFYELSRLVIQTQRKNAASFLIANSLKQLEKPCAVVSYADSQWNHCGYVYQATNWIYTGGTISHDNLYLVDGEKLHPMSIRDRYNVTNIAVWAKENNIKKIKPCIKHRYFYFCGNKKQKKEMLNKLSYKIISEYPKVQPDRYDDGPIIQRVQETLF